jgi:hypothetical protein
MLEPSHEDYTTQIIMSVIGGLIIMVSEILPFIKSVKSNGVLELLVNTTKTFLKKSNNEEENEPLINNQESDIEHRRVFSVRAIDDSITLRLDSLNSGINTISYTLNSYIQEAQNSRQLKLQSIEMYELNYIINYIKVNYPKKMFQTKCLSKSNKQLLISQGYIIDYDSQNDTHTIKW